jgi:GcrA cell cycle regulator
MSSHLPTWTPHRIDELRKHFEAGLSCSQIAGEIGVTRNAVIGKLSRLGLSRPQAVRIRRQPRPRASTPRLEAPRGQVRILRALHAAMAAPAAVEAEPVSDRPRCSLFELSAQSCRWPIGRPGAEDFGFCGSTPVEGLPYCAGHARLAYRRTASAS